MITNHTINYLYRFKIVSRNTWLYGCVDGIIVFMKIANQSNLLRIDKNSKKIEIRAVKETERHYIDEQIKI